ncbi:DNA polymerase/3'-5' exonuclease PolX [Aquibacillus sp. 3ASR75-11]|uniref:DNA-directed DNA polymerase n=1 Tax=Terrihalobacillus insolitus TaxID=2950438 RepID=A0A9X4AMX5_9BACI|nr:DNA polymerase/3'-5' exonuclease PolX [Terrihalobacillus insolitus]MDC3412589.1 DNA polymerase/3'-5' exonuclease PolX [Terrihalobacillus insolitus]MDC3423940.1 DNA polymerase/3'-5' exonuclease PolX [Terrihalobacillus insolitus]
MEVNKKDVIKLLENVAIYLELKGENPFKIAAYRKAAQALETDDRSLSEIDDFAKINGIGKGTSTVIQEYIEDGVSDTLLQLEKEVPSGLVPLLQLPGLGGKKLAKLYKELGVIDAQSLKEACESGNVEQLSGFGKKSSEKILKALEESSNRPERLPLAFMLPITERIETFLNRIASVERYSRAGSIRRMKETIRDLDFIIATNDPSAVKDALLEIENKKDVIASGETKVSVVLDEGYDVNVDFRIVEPKEFATTLHHFTGSKDHNVALRQVAKAQGEKISEYGIEQIDTGEVKTFNSETDFFAHFGFTYIPPEVRENNGEIEAFRSTVPLVSLEDIRGDLHMHTSWSDGAQSIEEMVLKAREYGYDYVAITDHSKFLRVANGLNEERLRKQREEINRLNKKYTDIHIFAGVEMDIRPDGTLDFEDDFLMEMDYVIGAIHSSFNQSQEKIMNRLFTALENPYVTVIAHPTGRVIGKRKGYEVDVAQLIQKAKETGTVLELNANPNRLDLSAEWVKAAQEEGVKIAINTDAHSYNTLEFMGIGVGTARKGWLQPDTVINTWSKEKLIELFQAKR